MRAVVDTNAWTSAVLNPTGAPAAVRLALQRQQFTLVTSEPLLTEVALVLARPRFAQRSGVTPADIAHLVWWRCCVSVPRSCQSPVRYTSAAIPATTS